MWEEIKAAVIKDFNGTCYKDPETKRLLALANAGEISTVEAQELADRIARCASAALRKYVTDAVADNEELFAELVNRVVSPMLGKCQGILGEVGRIISQNVIDNAGVGLKAVSAADPTRVSNLAEKMLGYEKKVDGLFLIDEQVVKNIMKGAVDETLRDNAEFMQRSGMDVRIRRTLVGKCCDYCAGLVYDGPLSGAPAGIWSRHRDCDCLIEYWNDKGQYSTVNNYRR